jgi:cell division protein ZapA (FtsZ GTPase activity inhibitor)
MKLSILSQDIEIECAPEEQRRLIDLAAALEARLARIPADADHVRRLVLTALSLLDETQAAGAALARAHEEIERLSDQLAEATAEEGAPPAGRDAP